MKHLYFLVPDLKIARGIVKELLQVGIQNRDIHVVGEDTDNMKKAKIPLATFLQTTDIVHAVKRGIVLGVIFSLAIYLFTYFVFSNDMKITSFGLFAIAVFGMGFGLWSSGMIAIGTHHPVMDKYANYVKEGHYIMMVDVPQGREHELICRVVRHHPGTRVAMRTIH